MGNLGDLKAQQLVLLAVFVSFITSVATGITTVSLIEAAPAPAQQVINRIVERTVERVVPEENPDENKPPEKEIVTVVVKEEDLAIAAAESVGKSAVRVFVRGGAFASLGLAVGPHTVVADGGVLSIDGEYEVEIGGARFPATVSREDQGFALVVVAADAPALSPAAIGGTASLKLAQSLVAVTGAGATSIATGALVGFQRGEGEGAPVVGIEASLAGASVLPGALLANIRGEVIGIRLEDGSAVGLFSTAEAAAAFAAGAAPEPAPTPAPAE
jgi:hypothetical protein